MTQAAAPRPDTNTRQHWAAQRERGSQAMMRLSAWLIQHLGRQIARPIVWVTVLYFYLTGRLARQGIDAYQRRLVQTFPQVSLPARAPVYRQFLAFADAMLDKLDAWRGRIRATDIDLLDPDGLHAQMGRGRGQLLVGAHLGNIEICRALAEKEYKLPLNVLVHSKHAQAFQQLLGDAGASSLRLIQVSELDVAAMMALAQALERGEWIVIAGDRVPLSGDRHVAVTFLGARALLPKGPWLLAGLLGCPVNLLTCVRRGDRHSIELTRLAGRVEWTRATREQEVAQWAQRYADHLAQACAQAPLQWFNFFPFWSDDAQPRHS